MVNEVKMDVNNTSEKVYSEDKKIYLGMDLKAASKNTKIMKIFDFADKNGDGVIDQNELNRYNDPIIVHNYETTNVRVLDDIASDKTEEKLIKENELDFYTGLTIEQVDKKGRIDFTKIDPNNDGIIQKEELKNVVDELKKIEDSVKQAKKNWVSMDQCVPFIFYSGIAFPLSIILACAGGSFIPLLISGDALLALSSIYKKLAANNKNIMEKCLEQLNSEYTKELAKKEFASIKL